LKIAVMPEKLIIPPNLDSKRTRFLRPNMEVGTNNNTVNVVRSRFPGGAKVIIILRILMRVHYTNVPDGMKYFERRADDFSEDDDF